MLSDAQHKFLEQFEVVRFKNTTISSEHLEAFSVLRESTLPEYLKTQAQRDDESGQFAVYVIRNKQNLQICAFFSLHCGSLFEGFNLAELEQTRENCIQDFLNDYDLYDGTLSHDKIRETLSAEHDNANAFIKALEPELKFKYAKARKITRKISAFLDDDKIENKRANINRVKDTFPSLELVHFCVDSNINTRWKNWHITMVYVIP